MPLPLTECTEAADSNSKASNLDRTGELTLPRSNELTANCVSLAASRRKPVALEWTDSDAEVAMVQVLNVKYKEPTI